MTGEPVAAPPHEGDSLDPLAEGSSGDKVIRGAGLRTAAHIVGVGGGLLSAPLVVRHLGVEDFGRYLTVTAIVTVATALTEGGLSNVAVRRMANLDLPGRRHLAANLLGLRILLGLLGALGAVAFGILPGREDSVVVLGLALGGLALMLNGIWGVGTTVLNSRLRLGSVALVELARSTVTTILLVALVVAGASLGAFYVVAPAAAISALLAVLWLARGEAAWIPRLDRGTWLDLLRETAIYAAATALGTVYFQVALVSTSILADDRETGTFGVAFRIVELANGIPWLLAASAFPVFARAAAGETARLRYATQRVAEAALALGGFIALGTVIGAGAVVELVGGSDARDAEPVLRILAPAALASYLVAAWSFVLLSLQRYRDLFVANLSALLASIALSIALVPPLGAEGAAIVTAALEIGLASAYALVLHLRRPDLGPRADNILAILLALLAGLVIGLALIGVNGILATVAALAAYAGVLVAKGGVPTEVAAALPRRRRP